MGETWQIQDAKNKLSEVITRALKQGPADDYKTWGENCRGDFICRI